MSGVHRYGAHEYVNGKPKTKTDYKFSRAQCKFDACKTAKDVAYVL